MSAPKLRASLDTSQAAVGRRRADRSIEGAIRGAGVSQKELRRVSLAQYRKVDAAHQREVSQKPMFLRNWIVLLAVCLGFAVLAGCGDSDNSNAAVAPPGGAFNNSNLNGTYVFSFSGYDKINGNGSFFAVVGSLTANGRGTARFPYLQTDANSFAPELNQPTFSALSKHNAMALPH